MAVTLPELTESCADHHINGRWQKSSSGERISVTSPIDGDEIVTVPKGTETDLNEAYSAAVDAQRKWSETTPDERREVLDTVSKLLRKHEEAIINTLAVEAGSTKMKGSIEVENTNNFVEYASTLPYELTGEFGDSPIAGKENQVYREPAGVIGVISPWNFPLSLTMRAVAPAVALGNSVVLKPSTETPITGGLLVAKLFKLAGLPDGVVNVVTGRGSDIGDSMAGHPEADVMAFTGSTGVGRRVSTLAAEQLTEPIMELGGNNPHIVLDDAPVADAVNAGVFGTFLHQGQVCISLNRHIVHESVYDEYVERLTERASSLSVGDPRDDDTVIGPIISQDHRDELMTYIEQAEEAGGVIETGGEAEGYYLKPTVISNVSNDMAAACNEHFGPIAPIISFSDIDEAVELANDTEYGLAASVYTDDLQRGQSVAGRIEAGMVHVNDQPINSNPRVPFGGRKASGLGGFNGSEILNAFTEPKWVSVQTSARDYPF